MEIPTSTYDDRNKEYLKSGLFFVAKHTRKIIPTSDGCLNIAKFSIQLSRTKHVSPSRKKVIFFFLIKTIDANFISFIGLSSALSLARNFHDVLAYELRI